MTCIVGLRHGGKVYIGGDSAGARGTGLSLRLDSKVFTNRQYVMGFTSSFRMGQLLQYGFKPPFIDDVTDDGMFGFMVSRFVPAVQETLKQGAWTHIENSRETGGEFLVGVKNRLFAVQSDFQVSESLGKYVAIGCGDEIALGSMHATKQMTDPTARIIMALEAAEYHSTSVSAPFTVIKTA